MGMEENNCFEKYNANPKGKQVGDCTVRAISKILDEEWEKSYAEICLQGFIMCDMPSANHVWGAYLRKKGFKRGLINNECPDCYTVKDFCRDNPRGRFLLSISGHVVTVIDGKYYDTWDSGDQVPIYFWYKEINDNDDLL